MVKLLQYIAKELVSLRSNVRGVVEEVEEVEEVETDLLWLAGWLTMVFILGLVAHIGIKRLVNGVKQNKKHIRIKDLVIYPIKSCMGIHLQSAEVAKTGLKHDRLFMLIAADTGKFVSQRKYPKMALIETSIDWNTLVLTISLPGKTPLTVPLQEPTESSGRKLKTRELDVWGDVCVGTDMGDTMAQWFCEALGLRKDMFKGWPLRFMRMVESEKRPTDPKYAPEGQTSFADGFPFLLAAEESLEGVNEALVKNGKAPITMTNFRPNIVITGAGAWEEDKWIGRKMCVGSSGGNDAAIAQGGQGQGARAAEAIEFAIVKPCARCTMPNVDPAKGEFLPDNEPTRTMKSFRSGKATGLAEGKPRWNGHLFFGQNLDHASLDGGVLHVGDVVTVIQ